MPDQTDTGAEGAPAAPEAPARWTAAARDAAAALLARLSFDPSPEQIDNCLDIATWRKAARDLLAAVDAHPAGEAGEDLGWLGAMQESALLAILAGNPEGAAILLSRTCIDNAGMATIGSLLRQVRDGSLCLPTDQAESDLARLQAELGPDDLAEASADPAFLIQLALQFGAEGDSQGAPADLDLMQQSFRGLTNVARLAAMAALLAETGQDDAADVYRMLRLAAEGVNATFQRTPTDWKHAEIDAVLQGVARAEATCLATPSPLAYISAHGKVSFLQLLAADATLPSAHRRRYGALGLQATQALYGLLRASDQSLGTILVNEARQVWMLAQLEPDDHGAERQALAITRLHELVAMAVLESDPFPRMTAMAGVTIALATALYELGRFKAASDQAIVACRLAETAAVTLAEAAATPGVDARAIRFGQSGAAVMAAQAQRADLLARAKLAENQADFAGAAQLYATAAVAEQQILAGGRDLMEAMLGEAGTGQAALFDQAFGAEPRAAHFTGLAVLNQADAALMEGRFADASKGYAEAEAQLASAAALWQQAGGKLSADRRGDALHEAEISTLRARYCDCKISLAEAEARVAANDNLGAAQHFLAARTVLRELVQRSKDVDEPRNQAILLGTECYAQARFLFEIDLDQRSDGNLGIAREAMGEAARHFAGVGEARWAGFIRAQAAACEAELLQARAEASAAEATRALLLSRAADRRQDAADIYAVASPSMAASAGDSTSAPQTLVLPKPQAVISTAVLQVSQQVAQADPRAALLARKQGLEQTIVELRDMRDRARVQAPEFIAMFTDYSAQLAEVTRQLEPEVA